MEDLRRGFFGMGCGVRMFVCGVGGGEGVVGDGEVGQRVCFWKRRRRREKKAAAR